MSDADVSLTTALLETFLALMPDAAVVVGDSGEIVSINPNAEALFGYPPDELVGRPLEVRVPERLRPRHRRDRAEYQQAPRTRPMGVGMELTGRRRDGREFPVDISLAPIGMTERPLVVAAVRDASERQTANRARSQLASIVESSQDGILSINPEGFVRSWNPGAKNILGYPAEDALGSHISQMIPADSSTAFEELLDAAASDARPGPLDTQWLCSSGQRLDIAVSVSPMRGASGELIGFSVMLRDITERKRAEAALRELLAQVTQQERWQAAMADIRLALLSPAPGADVLTRICDYIVDLLDADSAAIVVSEQVPRVAAARGTAEVVREQLLRSPPPVVAETMVDGAVRRVSGRAVGAMVGQPGDGSFGDGVLLALPVPGEAGVGGVLLVGRDSDREFSEAEIEIGATFAAQTAMAIELGRARDDRERLLLAEDRERIGRDLHDLVIQRLFGSAMGLQSIVRMVDNPRAAARVNDVIEQLDTTIRDIRTAIFSLAAPQPSSSGLRAEILSVAEDASGALGFYPSTRFDGPVDTSVPDHVAENVVAVVREALSNIARHASARTASVELLAGDDVVIIVTDDGVGLGPSTRRSGLANLEARAERLGGTLRHGAGEGGRGTRLEWRVPIDT